MTDQDMLDANKKQLIAARSSMRARDFRTGAWGLSTAMHYLNEMPDSSGKQELLTLHQDIVEEGVRLWRALCVEPVQE